MALRLSVKISSTTSSCCWLFCYTNTWNNYPSILNYFLSVATIWNCIQVLRKKKNLTEPRPKLRRRLVFFVFIIIVFVFFFFMHLRKQFVDISSCWHSLLSWQNFYKNNARLTLTFWRSEPNVCIANFRCDLDFGQLVRTFLTAVRFHINWLKAALIIESAVSFDKLTKLLIYVVECSSKTDSAPVSASLSTDFAFYSYSIIITLK